MKKLKIPRPTPTETGLTFLVGGWVKQRVEIFDPLLSINPAALISGLNEGKYVTSVELKQIEETATGRPVATIIVQDLETEYTEFEGET